MLKHRLFVFNFFVVIDPDKNKVALIMLKPLRILLPVDLSNRGIRAFLIFQFNQHRRNIRSLRDKRQIRVSFSGIELRNDRIIILRRIVCKLYCITQSGLAVVSSVPRFVVRALNQFRNRLYIAGPCRFKQFLEFVSALKVIVQSFDFVELLKTSITSLFGMNTSLEAMSYPKYPK